MAQGRFKQAIEPAINYGANQLQTGFQTGRMTGLLGPEFVHVSWQLRLMVVKPKRTGFFKPTACRNVGTFYGMMEIAIGRKQQSYAYNSGFWWSLKCPVWSEWWVELWSIKESIHSRNLWFLSTTTIWLTKAMKRKMNYASLLPFIVDSRQWSFWHRERTANFYRGEGNKPDLPQPPKT